MKSKALYILVMVLVVASVLMVACKSDNTAATTTTSKTTTTTKATTTTSKPATTTTTTTKPAATTTTSKPATTTTTTTAVTPKTFQNTQYGFSFNYPGDMIDMQEGLQPAYLGRFGYVAGSSITASIVVNADTSGTVKETIQNMVNKHLAQELEEYTESNVSLNGTAGKRVSFIFYTTTGTLINVVGLGWTKKGNTIGIIVNYWDQMTTEDANTILDGIIASLKIN